MRLVYERKRALPSVQPMNNAPFIAERLAALIEEIRSEDAKIEDSASYKLARWADELVAIRAEVEAGHAAIEAALALSEREAFRRGYKLGYAQEKQTRPSSDP